MKKILIAVIYILGITSVFAQKSIDVVSKDFVIEKITRTGLATTIELDEKYVKDLWKKYLKDFGKVESKGDVYWIEVAQISAISNSPVKLQSGLTSSGKGTTLWIGVDLGDTHVKEGGEGYAATKKFLRDFALSCYKADMEAQIKEAEDAFSSSQKKDEKVIKEGEKLTSDLESNASEKIKLEEALKKNAENKIQLTKDLDQNKKDQTASKEEVTKMKKALELKQAEMNTLK